MNSKIYECTFCGMDKTKFENTILDEKNNFYIYLSVKEPKDGVI